jgi:2-polyprenyl-6-methoxyphenol hydroxylase-like FAD-dependent oxidoreductase
VKLETRLIPNTQKQVLGTLTETPREIPIIGDYDVVVAGGGPAGWAAATAAGRQGARTLLIERYGYLGGMATGALVIMLDHWDDFEKKETVIGGLPREMIDRLGPIGGVVTPDAEDLHKEDQEAWDRWGRYGWTGTRVPRTPPSPVPYGAVIEPEKFKYLANRMLREANVTLRYHSWVVGAVAEDEQVRGVIIESKSGRQAVLAKQVIDCTGDGDVFAAAGAPFSYGQLYVTLPHQVANVDTKRYLQWEWEHPDEDEAMQRLAKEQLRSKGQYWWLYTVFNGLVWVNAPTYYKYNILDAEDLTEVELESREVIEEWWSWAKDRLPGFENSYVVDVAAQLGVRQSRLLDGEYTLTKEDVENGTLFPDTIGRSKNWYLPYRTLVPKKIDNLLVAGRCYAATPQAQAISREVPTCMVLGEAAGTAAALAAREGVQPRQLDVSQLRGELRERNVILEEPVPVRGS